MSTRKRPLAELPQPSQAHTPTRYAPLTPHAIRALQERSGHKTRSIRKRQLLAETVRPNSARGILKRLAKITAPNTRRITRTPVVIEGKENQPEQNEDEGSERGPKKPHMAFDVDESIEEDDEPPEYYEEDSELPSAPTPSILPDDNNPTLTFKSIDFARNTQPMSEKINRRKSRISFAGLDRSVLDENDDPTLLSEIGRRAISEEPTGRLSRYSFGSIRMSDFGSELEIRRDSNGKTQTKAFVPEEEYNVLGVEEADSVLEGETENLGLLGRSPGFQEDDGSIHIPGMDDSFRLEIPEDEEYQEVVSRHARPTDENPAVNDIDTENGTDEDNPRADTPDVTRQLTRLETLAQQTTTRSHRRKMKITKNGALVPSLASSLVKRIATEAQVRRGSRKPILGKEHVKALEQATEWFFEQVGEDLAAYATHGRRKKTIDKSDVLMLMQRQRVLTGERDLRELAKDWIPPDVLADLDLT